ncbi:hypothetical protein KP509_05G020100 [Ceratopteris richardii]|uniref:Uncharacterized protein n=1 Tax=Ceratopteris richardii TaxID=49495 RepID=A0A8T2URC4_CERRI|nr:hypothetical protein KP509_05G020100 [Ceratopteris richardii]
MALHQHSCGCQLFFLLAANVGVVVVCTLLVARPAQAYAFKHRHANNGSAWLPATATWYGSATGDGSDGGACGYGKLVGTPYGKRISAVSPVLYRNGEGCGACYQVKCAQGGAGGGGLCSRSGVRVVITDECPGGYCAFGRTHFDMSGSAFRRLAFPPSNAQALLNEGVINVLYRRVPCHYRGRKIAFQVNDGATHFWFSVLIRYEADDGDLSAVELMEGQTHNWIEMKQLWGAYWCLNGGPLEAPFSIRIRTSMGSIVTAFNAIPSDWAPGKTYTSHVNFP